MPTPRLRSGLLVVLVLGTGPHAARSCSSCDGQTNVTVANYLRFRASVQCVETVVKWNDTAEVNGLENRIESLQNSMDLASKKTVWDRWDGFVPWSKTHHPFDASSAEKMS